MTTPASPYPLHVEGHLDAPLSRGLWLVKWLLAIPHFIVLAFLWLAFFALTIVVFFAILITGRYPRALFDFNVGVLRWTWRVQYYSYAALGTDRYPPFTLADVPDYPARLNVDYPNRLSRGLIFVKWLLALPHYLVTGLFVGGGIWVAWQVGEENGAWAAGGLVGLLVLVAGVVLLFTGRYPQPIFDFVLGMDRWVFRVAAYVGLMTDRYPPFRLDMGGADPDMGPPHPATPLAPAGASTASAPTHPAPEPAAATSRPGHTWTGGRVVAVVSGAVLLFLSTGLMAAGGGLLWADQTQRNDGYLWSPSTRVTSDGYAITSDQIELDTAGSQWVIDDVLGTARLRVTPLDSSSEVFVGVAASQDVADYLRGVAHHQMGGIGRYGLGDAMMGSEAMTHYQGGPPSSPPGELDIWVAQSSGSGVQVVNWTPADGTWTVVVMRADADPGVAVQARAGVTAPGLAWVAGGLLGLGVLLLVLGGLLIALAVHRASASPPNAGQVVDRPIPPDWSGTGTAAAPTVAAPSLMPASSGDPHERT